MKKTFAMILTLIAILSLCACGTNEAVQPNDESNQTQQQTTPSATAPAEDQIPNLSMFEGKWNIVGGDFLDEITTFVIHADGTLTANDTIYTWTASMASPNANCEMILQVSHSDSASWAFDLRLTRTPEDTYAAEMRVSKTSNTGDQFYRDADYKVVEITDENAMEYLQQVPAEISFNAKENNASVNEYTVVRTEVIRFKDGVGALSYCSGKLLFEQSYIELHLTDNATGFTQGDATTPYVDQNGKFSNISIAYPLEYTYTVYWFGEVGSADLQKAGMMECNQLIGTKDIHGYIFIPV